MKILLTGGGGMLGSHLVEVMERRGIEFSAPRRGELDLLNGSEVQVFFDRNHPDLVIHAAAVVGGIKANIKQPTKFIVENLLIDSNIIAASLKTKVANFLYMSSSCVYPAHNRQPMQIEDILDGKPEPTNQGYAIAKIAGMQMMKAIETEHDLAYKSLVLSNLYGPRDNFDLYSSHLVAAALRRVYEAKISSTEYVSIMGSGSARREFTYVGDVAEWTIDNLSRIADFPSALNLGYGTDYSVNDFYRIAAQLNNFVGEFTNDLSAPEGMARKLMDSDLAARNFRWCPKVDLLEGMKRTLDWWLMQ